MNLSPISFVAARLAQTTSAPVSSEVSPKQVVAPKGSSLSIRLPTVGQEPRPEVVSLSPHFVETKSSSMEQDSRCFSLAHWTNSRALREALAMVVMSPLPSIAKPATSRSEEHTSELQSPDHLVCRLLLEKKNNTSYTTSTLPVSF